MRDKRLNLLLTFTTFTTSELPVWTHTQKLAREQQHTGGPKWAVSVKSFYDRLISSANILRILDSNSLIRFLFFRTPQQRARMPHTSSGSSSPVSVKSKTGGGRGLLIDAKGSFQKGFLRYERKRMSFKWIFFLLLLASRFFFSSVFFKEQAAQTLCGLMYTNFSAFGKDQW